MKSVLVFALFATVAIVHADDEKLKEQFDEVIKSCAEKTHFSEEGIKKLHANDLSDTENVQCFQKCVFENSGIIKDNALNGETIHAVELMFKKDVAKTTANLVKCAPLYKPDTFDCDAAWEIYKCFN